jgi:hypothetical protein
MGPVRGASDGEGRRETCDLGPSRYRASSPGPRLDARPLIGCAGSSRRGRCPAVGTRTPAPERDGHAGGDQAGRAPRRRTRETAQRSRQIVSIRVVVAHGAGPHYRAFNRSMTFGCYADQRPRPARAWNVLAGGEFGDMQHITVDTPLRPTLSLGDATRPAPVCDIPRTDSSRSSSNRRRPLIVMGPAPRRKPRCRSRHPFRDREPHTI